MSYTFCVYRECKNTSEFISTFPYPVNDRERLERWIRNSGSIYSFTNEELRRRYICAAHFLPGDISKGPLQRRLLGPAVPIHYESADFFAKFLEPCSITDFECLKRKSADFFEKTVFDSPELGTVAIDSLGIPDFDIVFDEDIGVTFKIRHLYVSGLRNQTLHAFNFDRQTRKLVFGHKADFLIGTNIVIDYTKKSNTFSGYFSTQPIVISNFTSDLLIRKNDQGVDYYDLDPITFTYEVVNSPTLDWGPKIREEFETDVAWNSQSEEIFKKMSRQTIYEILNKTYPVVISNYRAALKVIPTATFLK